MSANARVLGSRITVTPASTSYEGYSMTGCKLIVEGRLEFSVEYMPNDPVQPVHTVSFNKPVNGCIILDSSYAGCSDLAVNTYIEDINIRKVNDRKLYFCVLLLLDAVSPVTL